MQVARAVILWIAGVTRNEWRSSIVSILIINGSSDSSRSNPVTAHALPLSPLEKIEMLKRVLMLLLLSAPALAAAATLSVEAVVSPAWLERAGGIHEPLQPGTGLRSGDRVITGGGARALLRMSEGSAFRLGENATFAVDRLGEKKTVAGRAVNGVLNVVQGAFRFTTGALGSQRSRRDLDIRIATVTAGIRGTDIWGKSDITRDIVCLIEGRIEVEHRGELFTMRDPLSFLIAPREGPRLPVAPVSEEQLRIWAADTEIAPASGASIRGGQHRLAIASGLNEAAAMQVAQRLRGAGYPAMIRAYRSGGALRYDVAISGLASPEDAAKIESSLRAGGLLS